MKYEFILLKLNPETGELSHTLTGVSQDKLLDAYNRWAEDERVYTVAPAFKTPPSSYPIKKLGSQFIIMHSLKYFPNITSKGAELSDSFFNLHCDGREIYHNIREALNDCKELTEKYPMHDLGIIHLETPISTPEGYNGVSINSVPYTLLRCGDLVKCRLSDDVGEILSFRSQYDVKDKQVVVVKYKHSIRESLYSKCKDIYLGNKERNGQ